MLPAPLVRVAGRSQLIDDYLPAWHLHEEHRVFVKAAPERVMAAVHESTFRDIPVFMALTRARAMAFGRFEGGPASIDSLPVLRTITQRGSGFHILAEDPGREIVIGMIGRPWTSERPVTFEKPEEFKQFNRPGYVKVSFNLRVDPAQDGGTRLATETRIIGTDDDARHVFARYWRLIYPGSGMIRRVWLDSIRTRVEQGG
jgi:hypothetical protein